MNDDTISRQAAIDDIREYKVEPCHCCDESEIKGFNDGIDIAISALATLPSAERRGRWVDLKCDQCGQVDMSKPNYCPNCGAKMDGEDE